MRTSIALGRPYRAQYRFRYARQRTLYTQRNAQQPSSYPNEIETHDDAPPSFDPWDKPASSTSSTATSFRPISASKNTLVTHEDSALTFGYDTHVKNEYAKIQGRTASEIHSILRVAASEGTVHSIYRVQACVNYLLQELGEGPSVRLYSALILAQCRADGSVAEVERLLEEMGREGLEMDNSVCHDILKVLSVHPDYILRTQVLDYMRGKWFQLSDGGWHDVTAGLVREGSLEMAMERVEEMQRSGIRVLGWLYDLLTYSLAEREEMDEVLRLLQERVQAGDTNISPSLFYHLLDASARVLHYPLASYIWNSRVRTRYLNPSSGICLNTMALAAREADTALAQDVFDFLGRRDTTFEAQHYEVLIESYVNAGVPENGFYILSAMQAAGVVPTDGTTRRLAEYLMYPAAPADIVESMFAVLENIREKGGAIPVAAVNVLLETASSRQNLEQALELYGSIPEICDAAGGTPNLATFNQLFRLCHKMARKDVALRLAGEMVKARVLPDALTYDRMMLVCLRATTPSPPSHSVHPTEKEPLYEDGMRYYREMRAKGFEPRFGSALALVRTLTQAGDARVDEVLDELEGMDLPIRIAELRKWVAVNFGKVEAGEVESLDIKGVKEG